MIFSLGVYGMTVRYGDIRAAFVFDKWHYRD